MRLGLSGTTAAIEISRSVNARREEGFEKPVARVCTQPHPHSASHIHTLSSAGLLTHLPAPRAYIVTDSACSGRVHLGLGSRHSPESPARFFNRVPATLFNRTEQSLTRFLPEIAPRSRRKNLGFNGSRSDLCIPRLCIKTISRGYHSIAALPSHSEGIWKKSCRLASG